MNGLPPDADLSPLNGRVLEQVRFASHQMQLILGDGHSVSIEGPCILSRPGAGPLVIEDYAGSATSICGLLGSQVQRAARTAAGGMRLLMSDATILELQVDREEFESFQVQIDGTTFTA
jgi:hypothetical protein